MKVSESPENYRHELEFYFINQRSQETGLKAYNMMQQKNSRF